MSSEETLFAEALQKTSAEERAAFLDATCAGDIALRQSVEALLAAHHQPDGPLERKAPEPDLTAEGLVAACDQSGSTIGVYKLRERIGEGGMGEVSQVSSHLRL